MQLLHQIEGVFKLVVQYGILLMECVGVTILLFTALKSICGIIMRDSHVRLTLAKGIALSLEFKLGGEVLRTVIVREWSDVYRHSELPETVSGVAMSNEKQQQIFSVQEGDIFFGSVK